MHPHTDELLRHLDANRVVLRAAVDAVPAAVHRTRPAPDRWSVAETLEHLARVEEQLTRFLGAKLGERAATLEPTTDTASILGRLDHRLILDRRRQITAGERVQPKGDMDSATAFAALEAARVKLRDLIVSYDGAAIDVVTHPHPVLGVIDAYQWFLFIGSHEARHADQIREIGATNPSA